MKLAFISNAKFVCVPLTICDELLRPSVLRNNQDFYDNCFHSIQFHLTS